MKCELSLKLNVKLKPLLILWVIPQKPLEEKKSKYFPLGLCWQCNHWIFSSFLPFLILLYFQCIIYPSPIMIPIKKTKKKKKTQKTKPAIQHFSFQLVKILNDRNIYCHKSLFHVNSEKSWENFTGQTNIR